jgi:hypothetical protein
MFRRVLFCFALASFVTSQTAHAQFGWSLSQKRCGRCGRQVALNSAVGDTCPYPDCGAYWGAEEKRFDAAAGADRLCPKKAGSSRSDALDKAKKAARQTPKFISSNAASSRSTGAKGGASHRAERHEAFASRTGEYSLRAADRGFVHVHDREGRHVMTLPHNGEVHENQFSPTEDSVVTVSGGAAWLYDLPKGERRCISYKNTTVACFVEARSEPTIAIVKTGGLLYFKATCALAA